MKRARARDGTRPAGMERDMERARIRVVARMERMERMERATMTREASCARIFRASCVNVSRVVRALGAFQCSSP